MDIHFKMTTRLAGKNEADFTHANLKFERTANQPMDGGAVRASCIDLQNGIVRRGRVLALDEKMQKTGCAHTLVWDTKPVESPIFSLTEIADDFSL